MSKRLVALISGRGSNLKAIIEQAATRALPLEIAAVISNRPAAAGLAHARAANIPTVVVDHRQFATQEHFDHALAERIDSFKPDIIALAGFMRILSAGFVERYRGRLVNIHPSLLPAYRGLDTHQRALDDNAFEHGASVHFVTPELDGGPVIAQARVAIAPDDTAQTLADRVLTQEHKLYPLALTWLAQQRLVLAPDQDLALFDGQPLTRPLQLDDFL